MPNPRSADRAGDGLSARFRSAGFAQTADVYTNVAAKAVIPLFASVTALATALRQRSWTPVILTVAAGAGSITITQIGKPAVTRRRPTRNRADRNHPRSPSFPSGHTLNSTVLGGIAGYLLLQTKNPTLRLLIPTTVSVTAFTVGSGRALQGRHWATDVLAGWALGLIWLTLVIGTHHALQNEADTTPDTEDQNETHD